jgi:hypothetical protein
MRDGRLSKMAKNTIIQLSLHKILEMNSEFTRTTPRIKREFPAKVRVFRRTDFRPVTVPFFGLRNMD